MTPTISAAGLTRRYRDGIALDNVTFEIEQGSITGLLGRNGAGKSTLLRIITAQEFATSGTIKVFGENPVENDRVLRRMVSVREDQIFPEFRVGHALKVASWFHPNWDGAFAGRLLADFDLPLGRRISRLSRGMRSALSITIGLAARAELTLFDEPYAGLDAVSRQIFYDHLLSDYAEHPRTILLSTHLIDEIADILERIILIEKGRIVLDAPADDVRGSAFTVTGPVTAVNEFTAGRSIWHRRDIGSRASVTMAGSLDAGDRARASALHLSLEPLSLQQLMMHTPSNRAEERESA